MREIKLGKNKANEIYNALVSIGGADESMRESFVYHHCESKNGCGEWRFSGKLGFGGKYFSRNNRVSFYSENKTKEREAIKEKIDLELVKINDNQ